MGRSKLRSLALVMALGWIMIATVVTPIRAKAVSKHHAIPQEGGVETDLISLLIDQAKESDYLREAHNLIEEVQSAPSCNQLAAYQLLASCKTLEVGADGTETPVLLERVKNLYAARLAVCELQSAHAKIPPQCSHIMSISLTDLTDEEQPRLNRLWYGRDCIDAKVLQPCLKALHDKSTSWTSYSNNRVQAITMCHAIRDHLEREQTANTHRKLVKVVSKMTDKTSEVSRVLFETQERHTSNHLEVQDLFQKFIAKVSGEMETISRKGVEVVDLLSDVTHSVASLKTNFQTMSVMVQNASSDVDMVRQGVKGILKPVVEASSEISSHLVDMKDFLETAKPFLLKVAMMAKAANDYWRNIQVACTVLLSLLSTLVLICSLTLVARCRGPRKRSILPAITAFICGAYVISQVMSMISSTISTIFAFISIVPDWFRTNDDVLVVSGLAIIAITIAPILVFWLDSIRQARLKPKIKQEQKNLQAIRQHDRHKNLAVDLGSSKHHQDMESDRFKRAETLPPQFSKSEWI